MYSVFRQIEIISVILRFIMPQEYGIISPPVEKVLGINSFGNHRMSSENLHLDKYSTYLKDLRDIKKERKFDRVADVDMALWVLQMGILERRFEARKCKEILQNFRKDSKLRAIQARNLTMYLFDPETMKRIELAESLIESDLSISGQIASIEFERFVKRKTNTNPKDGLRDHVERLCRHESGDFRRKVERALNTRNTVVHPDPNADPNRKHSDDLRKDIKDLIDVTRQIRGIEK